MSKISSRPVICQGCREKFVRIEGNFIKASKGFYHKDCYAKIEGNQEVRKDIFRFLDTHWGEKNTNYALVNKQIKGFVENENYPFTESGIMGTLVYLVEVKNKKLSPKYGISLVGYLYNEAKNYYLKQAELEGIEKKEIGEKIVVVKQSYSKENKLTDLELLMEGFIDE